MKKKPEPEPGLRPISRAKYQPTAEKSFAVSGVEADQPSVSTSSSGYSAAFFFTIISRIRGFPAFGKSCAAVSAWRMANSMFDCPEATHTSPTSTSSSVTVRTAASPSPSGGVPFTVSSNGPPAAPGFR
jgi:hypothetical protein